MAQELGTRIMYHRPTDPNNFLLEVLDTLHTAKKAKTPVSTQARARAQAQAPGRADKKFQLLNACISLSARARIYDYRNVVVAVVVLILRHHLFYGGR